MRKTGLILVIFVLLLSQFGGLPALAAIEGDFEYNDNGDGTATIIDYIGAGDDVIIPNMLDGKIVTTIGGRAFRDKGLTSVEIPASVTIIMGDAFHTNELENVEIPSGVTTIGYAAFHNNKLTSVDIPAGVTIIESEAFSSNELVSVKLHANVTEILERAFYDNKLEAVTFYDGLTTIGVAAFGKNKLDSLVLPDSVTSIGNNAFSVNELTHVEIPSSVTSIGSAAFQENNLTRVTFEGTPSIDQTSFFSQSQASIYYLGWFTDEDFTAPWDDTVLNPMTIYAQYTYKVLFDTDGGSAIGKQDIARYGKAVAPAEPTKIGHTFAGWYKEANFMNEWDFATDIVTQATTLYAKWTSNSYTLSFDANGGSTVTNQDVDYNEKTTEPTAPTKAGYTFAGWYKDAGLTPEWNFATDVVTQATTLYAKWTSNSYTLSFDTNGGSTVTNQDVDYNEKTTEPTAPTKAGYTFVGWYKEATFTNEWNFTTDVVKENTTLYAKWTTNAPSGGGGYYNDYKLTFNTNEGSIVASQTLGYNEKAVNPIVPTKAGYTFAGWYKEATFINEWDFATDVVRGNTTLYAKWTSNPTLGGSLTPIPVQPPEVEVEQPEESTKPMCTTSFIDITSHWAQTEIEDIACRSIIIGYPDGTFRPNKSITREHVALMFTRTFELTPIRNAVSFNDVPTNHRYYDAVTQVYQAGIFDGAPNGKFNPDAYMTRAQMAKVLVLAFELQPSETSTNGFRDVSETHWAKGYIAILADNGIALGDDGNFKPEESVTRAQFVAFMYRALNL